MLALNIDALNELQLQVQELIGKSTAVLGITGSGKTNTTAVLIEELLANGLPLTIVDIEGEYWGLKEKFEILVAGRSSNVEVAVAPSNAGQLADISIRRGISVILDLSDFHQEEIYEFLTNYFTTLWEASSTARRPYQIRCHPELCVTSSIMQKNGSRGEEQWREKNAHTRAQREKRFKTGAIRHKMS